MCRLGAAARWWRGLLPAAPLLGLAALLATCTHDAALGPELPAAGRLDLTGLLRAGGQIPIPIDQVRIELRRARDSSVVFDSLYSAARFGSSNDSLSITIQLRLRESPEQLFLYAEASGGGVLYYTVRSQVTAEAGRTMRTAPLTPTYEGPGKAADSVTLALAPATIPAGDSALAVATVWEGNLPVANAPVGFLSSDSSKVRVRPLPTFGQAWLVAAPNLDDSVDITAITPSQPQRTAVQRLYVSRTGGPGPPATVTPVAGALQTAVVNTAVGVPPAVVVQDAGGLPVPGVAVGFTTVGGRGTLTGAAQVTSTSGIATLGGWTVGTVAGEDTVLATVQGLPPARFRATVLPGPPSAIVKLSGDGQSGPINALLPQPLQVEVRDQFGNPVPAVTVTFTASDGSVSPSSATTDAQGRAQTAWTLGQGQANPTATAAVGAVQTVFTATTIFPTPAVLLSFAGIPGVGVGLTAQVNVVLTQPAPAGGVAVSLTSGNAGIFTVAPASLAIAQGQTSGTATVTGVSVGQATLDASAPGFNPGQLTVDVQNRNISVPPTLNVPFGQTASLPIQLPAPAPPGGVTFTVASSDPTRVGVLTPTVTIGAGG